MVVNSLNFCLSEKLFISPSILNEILTGYSHLGCRFFPFSTLNISFHSLLACRFAAARSVVEYIGFPLYVTCCFSLAAVNILSLCLVTFSLISMCLDVFLLGLILYGTLCASWARWTICFPMLGKFSNYILFKNFLIPFVFLFFFWDPYNLNVGAFELVPEVTETVLSSFHSFLLYSALQTLFHHFIIQRTDSFFCFKYSAIDSF